MKKVFFFLIILFFGVETKAGDFWGGDISMVNIKDSNGTPTDTYKWRMKYYRNTSNPIKLPVGLYLALYMNGSTVKLADIVLSNIVVKTVLTYPDKECYPYASQNSIELGIYESNPINYSSLSSTNGYYVVGQFSSSSLAQNLRNYNGSVLVYLDFPKLNTISNTRFNSSPEFKNYPSKYYSVGKMYSLDWSANDIDGDSLSYSFITPYGYGDSKPFSLCQFANGFKLDSNIANGNPDLTINPKTGIVTYKPMKSGYYSVAMRIDEYRKINGISTKIGSVYRNVILFAIISQEFAPTIKDGFNREHTVIDTIILGENYSLNILGNDILDDSLKLYAITSKQNGENLFDPNLRGAKWGTNGSMHSGSAADNKVILGKKNVSGVFIWEPKCNSVRAKPYEIKFVVTDNTCPKGLTDTLRVILYVHRTIKNNPPVFVLPDTISNRRTLKYYINQGQTFSFGGDTILKAYDRDSLQVVNINLLEDPNNGSSVNSTIIFNSIPGNVNSFANFQVTPMCGRVEPYRFIFYAYDNDCALLDTTKLTVELFVKKEVFVQSNICGVTVDSNLRRNILYWSRQTPSTKFYIIYREGNTLGVFDSIATLPANSTNYFIDFTSNKYPLNVNYKIASINDCDGKSPLSLEVKNIYLSYNNIIDSAVKLQWVGFAGNELDSFIVWKSVDFGPYRKLSSLPNNVFYYNDYNSNQAALINYKVELKRALNCNVPINSLHNYKMYSNNVYASFSSSEFIKSPIFSIHPNPSNSNITISGLPENELNDLFIFDILGKQVLMQKVQVNAEIDLTALNRGVYFVRVGATTRKLIKN